MKITMESTHSLRHFARHIFLVSRVHAERSRAKHDVDSHLQKMRKSIIRMNLGYSDIDRLKEKVSRLVESERKYSKFFKPEDDEAKELKSQMKNLLLEKSKRQQRLTALDKKIREKVDVHKFYHS